jgi:hypothetical protein
MTFASGVFDHDEEEKLRGRPDRGRIKISFFFIKNFIKMFF